LNKKIILSIIFLGLIIVPLCLSFTKTLFYTGDSNVASGNLTFTENSNKTIYLNLSVDYTIQESLISLKGYTWDKLYSESISPYGAITYINLNNLSQRKQFNYDNSEFVYSTGCSLDNNCETSGLCGANSVYMIPLLGNSSVYLVQNSSNYSVDCTTITDGLYESDCSSKVDEYFRIKINPSAAETFNKTYCVKTINDNQTWLVIWEGILEDTLNLNYSLQYWNELNETYMELGTPDGVYEWNVSDTFNYTNQTANLTDSINTYMSSCSNVKGYCEIPLLFHSETAGILEYSNLNITYTFSPNITFNDLDNYTQAGSTGSFLSNWSLDITHGVDDTSRYNITENSNSNFTVRLDPSKELTVTGFSENSTTVEIYINSTASAGTKSFEITATRYDTGETWIFPVNITVSGFSAIIDFTDKSDITTSLYSDQTLNIEYLINNTGNNNASNCTFAATGSLNSVITTNETNFFVDNGTTRSVKVSFVNPSAFDYSAGDYYLWFYCVGTNNDDIVYSSTPYVNLDMVVTTRPSTSSGGGGGGGDTTDLEEAIEAIPICGDGYCDPESESLFGCPQDCSVNIDELFDYVLCLPTSERCAFGEAWFINATLIGVIGYTVWRVRKKRR
jgi:hypothetical protein